MRFSLPAVVAFLAAGTSSARHLRQGPEARADDRKLQARGGVGIGIVGKDYKDAGGDRATYTRPLVALGRDERTDLVTLARQCHGREAECCAKLAEEQGGTVMKVFERTHGCELAFPDNAVSVLSGKPEVAATERNAPVWATDIPWGLDRIDQPSLPLDDTSTKVEANGTRVFIIDTGIRPSHNDFDGDGYDYVGDCHVNTIDDNGLEDNCHGHGTHVASTACGKIYGVAQNCEICSVKVLGCDGRGTAASVIEGIEYAIANCPPDKMPCVANLSLGGGLSSAVNAAVASAHDAGVVMVVAAGNDGADACDTSPASEPKAITVGSTTITDEMSWFSNHGDCVDVYDPGSSITAAWINDDADINTISGTSMASPHVAGIAAGVIAQMGGPGPFSAALTPAKVAQNIRNTTVQAFACTSCNIATIYERGPTPPPTPNPPTPPPTPCAASTRVVVKVTTDDYPQETFWEIKRGGIAEKDRSYSDPNTEHEDELCLPSGEYDFTINDKYGDGICCGYGSGAYSVTVGGETVVEGGEFAQTQTTEFEVYGEPTTTPTPPPVDPPTPPPVAPPSPPPVDPPTPPPVAPPTPPPVAPPLATGSYYLGCGSAADASHCDGQTEEADVGETHELRCCSSTPLNGWKNLFSADECWGLSKFEDIGDIGDAQGCVHAINFNEGRALCVEAGGDLCTLQQLEDDCTRGTGCFHDNDFIWSLDPVSEASQAFTTASTFFSCAQYSEASCTAGEGCQWTGDCHNCGCVPLPL